MVRYLIVLLLMGSSARAEDKLPASQTFKVCTHVLPPHSMQLADGRAGGLATEVLQSVAGLLGWQLKIQYYPWLRARSEVTKGHCDLIYTILKKQEYEEFVAFPEEHLDNRANVLIVRADSQAAYNGDLEAFMRHHRLGIYRDKVVSPLFDQLKVESWAKVEYANVTESILRMLLSHRVDAVVENEKTAIHELKVLGKLSAVRILTPPVHIMPAYIAFSRKGRALPFMKDFDEKLGQLKKTKEFREMLGRYEMTGDDVR